MNQEPSPLFRWTRILSFCSAYASLIIAVYFLICWQLGAYSLLTAIQIYWPFPFPTSICLALSAVAFLNILHRPNLPIYRILGLGIVFISGLRIAEIALGTDLGISAFLLKFLFIKPEQFWPMRLLGAALYLPIGASFVFWPKQSNNNQLNTLFLLSYTIIFFIALQGALINLFPIQTPYTEDLLPIHLFAACSLIILSLGLIAWRLHLTMLSNSKTGKMLPWIVTIGVICFNLFFLLALLQQQYLFIHDALKAKGSAIEYSIQTKLHEVSGLLLRQTARLENHKDFATSELVLNSKNVIQYAPFIKQIGWTDAQGTLLNSVTKDLKTESTSPHLFISPNTEQIKTKTGAYIKDKNIILYSSIYFNSKLSGFLFYEIDTFLIFSEIKRLIDLKGYEVLVFFNQNLVYRHDGTASKIANFSFEDRFNFEKIEIKITVTPNSELFLNRMIQFFIVLVTIGGVLGGILTGVIIHLFQALREKTANLEKTKNELEISEGILRILNQSDSMSEATEKVAAIIHRVYGWELFIYWLWDEKKNRPVLSQAVTTQGINFPHFIDASYKMVPDFQKNINQVLKHQKPYWSYDFSKEQFVRSGAALQDGLKGMVMFPIYKQNKLMGIVELYKRTPFSDPPDQKWVEFMNSLGTQFGLFIERREADLIRSEFTAVVTTSFDPIYTLDPDLHIKRWNKAAEKLYGWTEEEIVGKNVAILFPETEKEHYEYLKKLQQDKKVGQRLETKRIRKDQSEVWVDITYSPICDTFGELSAISVIAQDITGRKRLERSKDELIAMVSHELRNPLSSIIGAVGILKNKPEFQAESKELLVLAAKNAYKLNQIINDIIDIEKIQLGKFEIHPQSMQLTQVIQEAIRLSLPVAKENQIELVPKDLLPSIKIQADPDRLIQVLLNLLSNAIKFSTPGQKVIIQMEKKGQSAVTSIIDQGCGIALDKQERLFKKFHQIETGTTKIRGTGLGLSISKGLIEQMGGRIGVVSEPNKGSTFYFEFPILENT